MTKKIKEGFENGLSDSLFFSIEKNKTSKESLKQLKDSQGKTGLKVTIDATHGGWINGNFRFYKFSDMRDGFESMIKPVGVPVLEIMHDIGTPIGRVEAAQFIPIEDALPGQPTCKIRVDALITDEKAIEQFLDGRYLTVSTNASAKNGIKCSICGEDIADWNVCSHIPGKKYEDKLCYAIPDGLKYSEITVVNVPADKSDNHVAGVVEMSFVQITDAIIQSVKDSKIITGESMKDNQDTDKTKKKDESNKSLEDQLKDSQVLLKEKELKITETDAKIKELSDSLADKECKVVEKDTKIQEISDALTLKDAEIVTLKTKVDESVKSLGDAQTEITILKDNSKVQEDLLKKVLAISLVDKQIAYREKDITTQIADCKTMEEKEKIIQKQVDGYLALSIADLQNKINEVEKERPVDFLSDIRIKIEDKSITTEEEKTKKLTSKNPGIQGIFDAHINMEEK